jgi:hypothetical protein
MVEVNNHLFISNFKKLMKSTDNVNIWLKRVFLFLLPIIILLILYIIFDPFKVIKKYDSYYVSDAVQGVAINRGYVSTSTFENNYSTFNYDSFIFGNSRSIFYEIADWKHYIDANSHCFHFDASEESLYGIYKKIKYLDVKNVNIKNVLFILDYTTLGQITPLQNSHLVMISPQLEENKNIIPFQIPFIRAFFTPKFMISYFDYKISGKVKKYMKNIGDRPLHYELATNEMSFPQFEKFIESGEYYTPERMKVFYNRDSIQSFSPVVIEEKQKQFLIKIKDIFIKNKTNYKIIINPLYDQKKLNAIDLAYLELLFGSNNVFDFSGINKLTNDYSNYYEDSHYRPHVAREILKSIYENK